MASSSDATTIATLKAYSEGRLGTRDAIAGAGLGDYAELLIALSGQDLPLPRPVETPRHMAHVSRARAILQPLLRRAD